MSNAWRETLADRAAVVAALFVAAVFPISAALRLLYPFEIEWLESELFQHTVRSLAGESLYTAPSATFSPTIYPPLFAWSAGLVAHLTGPSLLAPRIVSTVATVASALLAWLVAGRLGGSRRGGLVAAALVLAAYVPCGTTFDLARVDALWVFALLAASTVALSTNSQRGAAVAGLLFAVATAIKQPSGLFALAAAGAIFARSRYAAATFMTVWLGLSALFYLALHLATDGWSTTYLVWIPLHVPQRPGQVIAFLRDDILRNFAPSVAITALWCMAPRESRPGGSLPAGWWGVVLAAGVATTLMRTLQGGGLNTLAPLCVFAATMVGAIAGRVYSQGSASTRLGLNLALLCQFAMLSYNPLTLAPRASDRARAEAFVRRIRSIPGDVWIPSHTSFAYLAGKPFWVHRDPLLDLQYSGWDAFPDDLEAKLRTGGFSAAIIDGPFVEERLQNALEAGYVLSEDLVDTPEPLVGYKTRPRYLYRPR